MTHTYNLIEARISIEAGKLKKKVTKKKKRKERKKRKYQLVSFRKLLLYVFFFFLSRLGKSSKSVLFCLFVCFFVAYK